MITSEQFFQHLRSALNHLYDPYYLRKSPLVSVFALGDRPDTPTALQRILNEAIQALEPHEGEASMQQRRRSYELITYRYVQQFSQEEVANQFGVSVRHLRREQNSAIYALAAYLWERYQPGSGKFHITLLENEDLPAPTVESPAPIVDRPVAEQASGHPDGMEWLRGTPLDEPSRLQQVLPAVQELSQTLAARYGVDLVTNIDGQLPDLLVQQVALRQMLLNLLSVAICRKAGSTIQIDAIRNKSSVEIQISCGSSDTQEKILNESELSNLKLAAQLAELYGGSLTVSGDPEPFAAVLTLPALLTITVMVIDDNLDFIQLIERYLTGTRFSVVSEHDPARALTSARQFSPDLILLDVMMPHLDGWEVLGRLRRHPATAHIPVIVCTILSQEELALSLGASSFVRKPVTQEGILAVLDQQSAFLERESH